MNVTFLCVVICLGSIAHNAYCDDQVAEGKITKIRLARSGGNGPKDALILRSDGTAGYIGQNNVERIGSYSGQIPLLNFEPSFKLLTQMYETLRGHPPSTGKPTERVTSITLTVVRDGTAEEIDDLCPGLDHNLWAFEMAVRGVASDIQWSSPSDAETVQPQRNRLMDEANPPKVELTAWGEEQAGVTFGLSFGEATKTGKHVVSLGKTIQLVVKLRNTSKTVVAGSYSEGTYLGGLPKVEDEAGNPMRIIWLPLRARLYRQLTYSLKPGEELIVAERELSFVPAAPEGRVPIPAVVVKPGKYKISFEKTGVLEIDVAEPSTRSH